MMNWPGLRDPPWFPASNINIQNSAIKARFKNEASIPMRCVAAPIPAARLEAAAEGHYELKEVSASHLRIVLMFMMDCISGMIRAEKH